MDIDSIRDASIAAVVEVGNYVAQSQGAVGRIRMKDVRNPQTDIDVKAEQMLKDKLHQILPEAGFILEEGESEQSAEYNWAIDPIDGTKFYSTNYPVYFTQIALMQRDQPILTIIYTPVLKQVFHAIRGKGAYLNNTKLAMSYDGPLQNSLVNLEIGKIDEQGPYNRLLNLIAPKVNRLWVVSGIMAPYLVTNTVQAYVQYYNGVNNIYDLAPRWLLHEEAGAAVHRHMYEGHELYISAHPTLVKEIEQLFNLRSHSMRM